MDPAVLERGGERACCLGRGSLHSHEHCDQSSRLRDVGREESSSV